MRQNLIFRILKWVLLSILGLLLTVFLLMALDHDSKNVELSNEDKKLIKPQKEYQRDSDSSKYYSLLEKFGKNKDLAKGFEIQCLLALSHYPELRDTPIEFLQQPASIQLSSRPDPLSILFPWIDRKYLVIISTEPESDPVLLRNTPFNEQVGILGHELAHTLYYQDKNSLQLTSLAYRYQYGEDGRKIERGADKSAIEHGLGYQLYDFAFYVRIELGGDTIEEIASEEGGYYLSPKEIAKEMKKYRFYVDTLPDPSTYFLD